MNRNYESLILDLFDQSQDLQIYSVAGKLLRLDITADNWPA